jgi:hypothetical protein
MDLFVWWTISISWSIAFLIVAGIYLYVSSRAKCKNETREKSRQKMEEPPLKARAGRTIKDFVFVWVLLGLLVFYIFSVQLGTGALSETVFAGGNIVVEALLVFYLIRNKDKPSPENQAKASGSELHAEACASTKD